MDRTIDPQLPWGYWLRVEQTAYQPDVYVDDETGMRWKTIREAFWRGRLGMPLERGAVPDEKLEHLHALLTSLARKQAGVHEQSDDFFAGQRLHASFYKDWLVSVGLCERGEQPHSADEITGEGLSVIHMLSATRPIPVRAQRPSMATVAQLLDGGLGIGPEGGEERLAKVEQQASRWDVAFLRRQIGNKAAIVLQNRGSGAVPVMETIWSLAFDTAEQRDRFYGWLCVRVDRWPTWVTEARSHLGKELTHRLLTVLAASLLEVEEGARGSTGAGRGRGASILL